MLRRPVSPRLAAAAVLLLPASLAAKPGAPSPNSPAKPVEIPAHQQQLKAPPCGLHETTPQRFVPFRERHATKLKASYAIGAIGETIKLKANLQTEDGTPIAFKSVEFKVDNQVVGAVKSDSKGVATINYKVPNKFGPKTWEARYAGNNKCKGSSGSSTVGTVRAPTKFSLIYPPKYANVGAKVTINGVLKRTTDDATVGGRELEVYVGGASVAKVATSSGGHFTVEYVPVAGANKPLDIKLQFLGDVLYNPKSTVVSMPLYPPKQTVLVRGVSLTGFYGQTLNTSVLVTLGALTGPKFHGAPVRVWYRHGDNDTTNLGAGTTNQFGVATVSTTLRAKPGVYTMDGFADVDRKRYTIDHEWGNTKLTVYKAPVTVSALGPNTVQIGAQVSFAIKVVRTTDKQGASDVEVCFSTKCVKTDGAGRATLKFTVPNGGGTGPRTFSFASKADAYHLAGVKNVAVQVSPNTN